MKKDSHGEPLYDGAKIAERMKERGLSDGKLAVGARLSRPTVVRIRRGLNTEVAHVLAVLDFLELDRAEVFHTQRS